MGRVVKVLGYGALWALVVVVIVLLSTQVRTHRQELTILDVVISVDELPNSEGTLISVDMVEGMLRESKISVVDSLVKDVSLRRIEEIIAANGFIERVSAYVNHRGVLHIDVVPRRAVARLLVDGYNCYITGDGFVFRAPASTSLYTPIVTGEYRPLFAKDYMGYVGDLKSEMLAKIEDQISLLDQERYPIYIRERENSEQRRAVRRRYINRSAFESRDDFELRVEELRAENQALRDQITYRQRLIDEEFRAIDKREAQLREEQKKVVKRCNDIDNLTIFVEMLESDPFWSCEVSQIVLSTQKGSGDMRVQMVVRSGRFMVTLGSVSEDMSPRLALVRRLYREVLPRVGWDRYREINVEFDNQVVCRR